MKPNHKLKLGVVLDGRTMAELNAAALAEDISRASWARRVLRQRLREIAAASVSEAAQ